MAVGEERQGGPGGGVTVVYQRQDGDGVVEPLLLDQAVDGAGVLAILDVKLVHGRLCEESVLVSKECESWSPAQCSLSTTWRKESSLRSSW